MADSNSGFVMNRKLGTITMLLSATGMGFVPLFSRMATRTDMFDASKGLNAGDSIGALMATGRMAMGLLFFIVIVLVTGKLEVFKKLKPSFSIIMGGLCIGLSLACYVTSTLLTSIANAVLFIYTGPVICIILAAIFRKERLHALQICCLIAVFVGMLFGNGIVGFSDHGFAADFNLQVSTPEFPQKGLGDMFGILSGVFYGANMFFNGYRKDADSAARGVWNFLAAAIGAGVMTFVLNFMGTSGIAGENWALNLHLSTFNWMAAIAFWIVCGPFALGLLMVAGRHLPAPDYGTIAYWEVPVALFIGIIVFGEAFTINTAIAAVLIIGGGAVPAVHGLLQARKTSGGAAAAA